MLKEPFNLNASVNEYIFARLMEDTNSTLMRVNKPVIMATQCRDLHTEMLQELANTSNPRNDNKPYDMATAPQSRLMDAFYTAMGKSYKNVSRNFYEPMVKEGHPLYDASKPANEQAREPRYKRYLKEYENITGFQLNAEGSKARQNGTQALTGYLPISPFQNSYAHRMTVLKNGTEILYAKESDMLHFVQDPADSSRQKLANVNISDERESDVDLYHRQTNWDGTIRYRSVGKAYTYEDAVGLSRLRPYMTDNDYNACAGWMRIEPEDRMSPQAMERAASILQYLTDEGIPYKVSPDMHPGQLKVDIGNTKQSIRLTDVRKNENFIGRGYNDGVSIYIGTSKPKAEYTPSIQDTKMLIQYMLGGQPQRVNSFSKMVSPLVGGPSKSSYNGKESTTTYIAVKDGDVSLRTAAGYSTRTPGQQSVSLSIRTKNNHSLPHMRFATQDDAEQFLRESIDSAKERFVSLVDVDMLIREAKEHEDDDSYVPVFSSDASIAPIQQTYWDVLRGKSELYRPTEKAEDETFSQLFEALGLMDDDVEHNSSHDVSYVNVQGQQMYDGTNEEKVRNHLEESTEVLFGSFEPDYLGHRFNPALVASFMDSPTGIYRNNDNIVAAMYKLEFTGDELRGDDFQTGAMKDRLLRFDADTAVRMDTLESPFMKTMYEQVKTTLETTACRVNPEDILIDKNGVIQYTAYETISAQGAERQVVGMVGQIFEPDAQGVIETRYNGSENRLFSPGYNAYIKIPNAESGSNFMERTRLRGLSQVMAENIAETIRMDLTNGEEEPLYNQYGEQIGVSVGTTTNINNTYRSLYTTGYKVNIERQEGESLKDAYLRQSEMTGMPKDIQQAVFETAARAFRFGNEYRDNSTVDAESRFSGMESGSVHALTNNNVMNYYNMTNHTNLAVTQAGSKGYSDDVQTGSGKNQGATRYMGVGVDVDLKTGEMIPVRDETGALARVESPLRKLLTDKFGPDIDAKPADRAQMVTSNLQSASGVAGWDNHETSKGVSVNGVGVAQLTLQGLTFDDGAVISKKFAELNPVITDDGKPRPLMPGDKICDFSGNKSIIAKIIDPEMDLAEAEKQGIKESVELFKANPDLDVVQAPYSAVSRYNAAGAKLAMRNPMDLVLPDGTTHEGCLGFAPVIITKHTANDHTKLYSEEQDVPSNEVKGRKISAQLGWVFSAKNSQNLMNEIYSTNNSATSNFREVLNVMGLDMDEVGTLRTEYQPHPGEERHIFQLPDMETIQATPEKDLVTLFRNSVDNQGGFLEIPFPITLPSGQKTQQVPPEQASRSDKPMYQLPVLSAHLRSGQTFEDGTSKVHDYTNQYARIFTNAMKYLKAEAEGNENAMHLARHEVQTAYGMITDDVRHRKFETKHNMMRDDFMAKRMPHSATAVWTPDTNLNLNQVAMNQDMMKNMGVKEGDHIMLWRDPILRDYGTRYMEVKRDDNLCGISVNPLVAVAFDGDFDGDSVGMWKPSNEESKKEAMWQYSFEMTMLDFTQRRENGDYKLIFNTGMDVVSAEIADEKKAEAARARGEEYGPTLRERRMQLEHEANEIYRTDMSPQARFEANHKVLMGLSDWAKDTLCHTCGTEIVSYKNLQDHMQSLVDIVDHGAKGSHKKLEHYAKYLGVEYEKDKDGHILPDTVKDAGRSLITEKDIADTEKATAIKSHGTGNAGAVSQRIVKAMRNRGIVEQTDVNKAPQQSCLSSALQLTYLATQGILQAKHDPVQAQILYDSVKGPIREVWRGRAVELKDTKNGPVWVTKTTTDMNGESVPKQATKEEWIESFMKLHTYKNGLDLGGVINEDHVRQVADALYNPDTGRMYDIEDDLTIQRIAAPMDILAYSTKDVFKTVCDMANRNVNIFDGKCNAMFMPKSVSKNVERLNENKAKLERGEIQDVHEGLRSIVKDDVQAGYKKPDHVAMQKSAIPIMKDDASVAQMKREGSAEPKAGAFNYSASVPETPNTVSAEKTATTSNEKKARFIPSVGSVDGHAGHGDLGE